MGGSQSRLRLSLGQAGDPPPGDLPQVGSGTGPGRPNQGERRSHWVPGVETLTSRGREQLDRQRRDEGAGTAGQSWSHTAGWSARPSSRRAGLRTKFSPGLLRKLFQSELGVRRERLEQEPTGGVTGAPGQQAGSRPREGSTQGPPDDSSAGRRQIGGQTGEDGRGQRAPTPVADKTLSLGKATRDQGRCIGHVEKVQAEAAGD